MTTQGGATDFALLIAASEALGPYCLIGGLAVDCFVEPVYTVDADFVVAAFSPAKLAAYMAPQSQLRIQFTTDDRHQAFLVRSVAAGGGASRVESRLSRRVAGTTGPGLI